MTAIAALIGVLLSLLLGMGNALAAVSASAHPASVDELETVRLSLVVTGSDATDPDLAPLGKDFEIIGTHTASRYTLSSAGSESSVEYTITLRPKRAGTLTIPSLRIGQEHSSPLTVEVTGTDPALRSAVEQSVFFDVEISRNPVYTQGETILTRRLFYSEQSQIYSDLPGPPEMPDAEVFPIGATRSYTSIRDGARFEVIEQRFALFPHAPGRLTVPSISITTSVRLRENGSVRRVGARVISPTVEFEALPIPPEWPKDTPWLPAERVDISDRWSPAATTLATGDPLERDVVITVTGNLSAAITPLDDQLPGNALRQYPEPPVLEDNRDGANVVGTRRSRYTLLAAEPGTAIVPSLRLTWWDVNARQVRVAESPSRTLTLIGSAPVKTDPDVLQEPGLPPAALPDTPAASDDDVAHEAAWLRLGMIVMLALFAVSMLVILGRLAWRRARTPRVGRLSRSAQRLRRRGALIQARRRLFSALERKDLELADDQLHRYLELRYACSRSAAEALFRAEGGGEVLRRLAGARFASPLLPAPAATEMRAALDGLRVRARPQPEALPPLFGYRDNISSRDKVGSRDERDRNSRQETVTPRFS